MSDVELKECPFCGFGARSYVSQSYGCAVQCTNIGCAARVSDFNTKQGADNAWNTRTASASIDTIRSMIVGEDARIVAARQRLRDAKAIHTIWSELPTYQAEPYAQANMNNIEHIIYSAICYLDGIDGPYLREALATSVEKG